MSFQDNLKSFHFNWETLNLLKEDHSPDDIVEFMNEVNFDKNLTDFLLNNSYKYVNSVLLRLKLYNKLGKSLEEVEHRLDPDLKHLILHLYTLDESEKIKGKKLEESVEVVEKKLLDDNVSEKLDVDHEEEDVNHFLKFYKNFITKTENKKDTIKSTDAYSAFTEWYVNDYGEEVPSKKELKNFLNDKLGKSKKSSWFGVVLNA